MATPALFLVVDPAIGAPTLARKVVCVDVDSESRAEIVPGRSIRLHGTRNKVRRDESGARTVGPVAYDHVWEIGDVAVYGGYNLTYTGTVTAIGPATVTIDKGPMYRAKSRMSIERFSAWNADFNLAAIQKRNSEWSD